MVLLPKTKTTRQKHGQPSKPTQERCSGHMIKEKMVGCKFRNIDAEEWDIVEGSKLSNLRRQAHAGCYRLLVRDLGDSLSAVCLIYHHL